MSDKTAILDKLKEYEKTVTTTVRLATSTRPSTKSTPSKSASSSGSPTGSPSPSPHPIDITPETAATYALAWAAQIIEEEG